MNRKHFGLLWGATYAFWASIATLSTLLPLYLNAASFDEGQIGFITGSAALGALAGRLLLGWAVDRWGTRPLLLAGAALLMVTAPPLAWTLDPWLLLGLRLLQGFAGAMFTSAALGFLSFTAPQAQRGALMSWWDTSGSAANLTAPVGAAATLAAWGSGPGFITAGVAGLICLLVALSLPNRLPAAPPAAGPSGRRILARSALLPAAYAGVAGYAAGALIVLSPLIGQQIGLKNVGIYLVVFSLATLVVRPLTASLSDRKGRAWVILPGMALQALGLAWVGLARQPGPALLAPFLFGMGLGSTIPGLMAWAVDEAAEDERGLAGNTFYALWEVGIFIGSTLQGALLEAGGLESFYLTAAVVAVFSAAYLVQIRRRAALRPSVG
jgi:MFS family permease